MQMKTIRTYSELAKLSRFEDRFNYCRLDGKVGNRTFGSDRYFNQKFYHSTEWQSFRRLIILRDEGFDLGARDCPILGRIYIHHLNPLSIEDLKSGDPDVLFNPEYFVSVSFDTHQAIHYGYSPPYRSELNDRKKWDTCPWRV